MILPNIDTVYLSGEAALWPSLKRLRNKLCKGPHQPSAAILLVCMYVCMSVCLSVCLSICMYLEEQDLKSFMADSYRK